MRHRVKKAILNRPADQRKALKRNLLTSLFLEKKVKTTEAKAKALCVEADKLIALVKRQKEDFNAIRQLNDVLYTTESSKAAWEYIQSLKTRKSGFTRNVKLGYRPGDGALKIQVELLPDTE